MENRNDAFDKIIKYERSLHAKNQKRIKVGIKLLLIIPICFLVIMFLTESNKVVFLALWIVSLFVIAIYLIGIEYMDYELQMKLKEFGLRAEDDEIDGLIVDRMDMEKIKRVADALSSENNVPKLEDKSHEEKPKERPRRPRPEAGAQRRRPEGRPSGRPGEAPKRRSAEQNANTKAMKDMVDSIGVEAAEEELMASIKRYVAEVNKSDQPIVVEPKKTAEDYANMRRKRAREKNRGDEE